MRFDGSSHSERFLKIGLFKRKQNLENDPRIYYFFLIAAGGKPAGSLKITPSEFFFFSRILLCMF